MLAFVEIAVRKRRITSKECAYAVDRDAVDRITGLTSREQLYPALNPPVNSAAKNNAVESSSTQRET